MSDLEKYFNRFRKNIIGIDAEIETPGGFKKLVYADWIASGRLYEPIEMRLLNDIGPMIGNTHSESSATGIAMTNAYHHAQKMVKRHVNAGDDDVLIFTGTGMTSAIAKLQRILGLKVPEQALKYCAFATDRYDKCKDIPNKNKPVVFLTHTEHHSNHTSWFETLADVVVLEPSANLTVDPGRLRKEIIKYSERPLLIGSFSGCSNVTGYYPPYYELAQIMHEHNGFFFVDFTLSREITDRIEAGDLSLKPGWIRLSLNPTMTNAELLFIIKAIKETVRNAAEWGKDYGYDNHTNEFHHKTFRKKECSFNSSWFNLD